MEYEQLETVITNYMNGLDPKIIRTLRDIQVVIADTVALGQSELDELLADVQFDEDNPKPVLVADCKGMFYGDPLETEESDEDPEEENVYDPDGVIVLVAANIVDSAEASLVLSHEIGHALGMDEDEVKALGLGVSNEGSKPDASATTTESSKPV